MKHNLSGPLPWQVYFLAFVLGLFAFRAPFPAAVALMALWWLDARLRGAPLLLNALIVFLFSGYGYAMLHVPEAPPRMPEWMEERVLVQVNGVVSDVRPRPDSTLRVVLEDVRCSLKGGRTEPLSGKLLWTWKYPKYIPEPGQSVQVRMRLRPVHGFQSPGTWDYSWYWQRRGVYWQAWTLGKRAEAQWGERPNSFGWKIRQSVREAVLAATPETQGGAMLLALLTGDRSRITPVTLEQTRNAGLAHTLALSGLHVGFIASIGAMLAYVTGWIFPSLLLLIPRPKLMVILAAPLVLAYAWLGQPSPSLTRAALMFLSWGGLLLLGRGRVLMDGLFAALGIIVLYDPLSVYDLSLQLSATAVAGIALLFLHVQALFPVRHSAVWRICRWVFGLFAVSLCATMGLLPLLARYFGVITPNLFMNVLWVPMLGCAVVPLGVFGLILSFVPPASDAGLFMLKHSAGIMDMMLELLQRADTAGWTPVWVVLRPLWPEMLGSVILLVAAIAAAKGRHKGLIPVASVGFLLLILPHWVVLVQDARDEVRLTVLDVGQGQSVLISVPGGKRYLVDGGGTNSRTFDIGKAVVGAALTHGRPPRVDALFMSHSDTDHSQGLAYILEKHSVGTFFTNGSMPKGDTGSRIRNALDQADLVPQELAAGDVIQAGTVTFEVLHPDSSFTSQDSNERSLVLRLVSDDRGLALIPGDIGRNALDFLSDSESRMTADVLLLPHHGSRTGLSEHFYEMVAPRVAVASCGFLNRYEFPHAPVCSALSRRGIELFSTSGNGAVTFRWRGKERFLEEKSDPDHFSTFFGEKMVF